MISFPISYQPAFMYSLSKAERLCSKILFEELLTSEISFVKYPFRVVLKDSSIPGEYPARIAISVSKKKFKRAVKRNRVKRLTREAYPFKQTRILSAYNPRTYSRYSIYLPRSESFRFFLKPKRP